jgi:hypothetical protein
MYTVYTYKRWVLDNPNKDVHANSLSAPPPSSPLNWEQRLNAAQWRVSLGCLALLYLCEHTTSCMSVPRRWSS